jgi:hypothetical protein
MDVVSDGVIMLTYRSIDSPRLTGLLFAIVAIAVAMLTTVLNILAAGAATANFFFE